MFSKNRKHNVHLPKEPLFFTPIYSETIWGGSYLVDHLKKPFPSGKTIGESWELSGFETHQTVVASGTLTGATLSSLVTRFPEELLGMQPSNGALFPLLVKFIDAQDALSVQVHPDDATAQTRFGEPCGKTECWYITHAGDKAALTIGFTHKLDKETLRKAIDTGTLEPLLNTFPVKTGEVYFIPAGTVHAIMGDVVIYEVQQSSATTLRMYDWQRTDASGKRRQLHVDDAVAVADCSGQHSPRAIEPLGIAAEHQRYNLRVACPYFAMEEYRLIRGEAQQLVPHHSFRILSVLTGSMELVWQTGKALLGKGKTVLLPAVCEVVSIIGIEPSVGVVTFIPDIQHEIYEPLIGAGYSPGHIAALGTL